MGRRWGGVWDNPHLVRMLQAQLASTSNGSISMVKPVNKGSDNTTDPAKRKRGQRPRDVKSYKQMNLSQYLSTDRNS